MKRLPRWMLDLGHTADGLFAVDSRQRITFWNAGAERLLGHAAADVIGRHCYDIVAGRTCSGKARCRPGCQVQRMVRARKSPVNFNIHIRRKNGSEACANASIVAFYRRGQPHTVHLVRDTTAQDRSHHALQAVRAALGEQGRPEPGSRNRSREARADPPGAHALSCLTAREVEILSLVASGFSNTAIAKRLGISSYTVRNHVQNALQKLGLHNKAQAVSYAYRNGLL